MGGSLNGLVNAMTFSKQFSYNGKTEYQIAAELWELCRTPEQLKTNQIVQFGSPNFTSLPEPIQRAFEIMVNKVIEQVVARVKGIPEIGGMALPVSLIPVDGTTHAAVAKSVRLKTSWKGEETNSDEITSALVEELVDLYTAKAKVGFVAMYVIAMPVEVAGHPNLYGAMTRFGTLAHTPTSND
jgi:hypothetical protein